MNQTTKNLLICLSLPFADSITAMENNDINEDMKRAQTKSYKYIGQENIDEVNTRKLAEEIPQQQAGENNAHRFNVNGDFSKRDHSKEQNVSFLTGIAIGGAAGLFLLAPATAFALGAYLPENFITTILVNLR